MAKTIWHWSRKGTVSETSHFLLTFSNKTSCPTQIAWWRLHELRFYSELCHLNLIWRFNTNICLIHFRACCTFLSAYVSLIIKASTHGADGGRCMSGPVRESLCLWSVWCDGSIRTSPRLSEAFWTIQLVESAATDWEIWFCERKHSDRLFRLPDQCT